MFPPLGSVQGVDPDTTVTLLGNGGFTTYEGCDPVSYVWKDSAGNEIADGTSVTITGNEGDEVVYYVATVDACGNKSNYATHIWVIAANPVTVTAPTNADGTTSSTVEATEGTDVTITPTGGTTSDVACDPVTYEFTAPDGTVTIGSTITVVAPDAGTTDTYSVRTLDSCGNTSPVADYNVVGLAVVVTAPTNASTVEATEGNSVTFTPVGGTTSSTNCEPVTYEFTAPDGVITTGASLTVTAPAEGTTDTYSVKTVDACGNKSSAVSYGVTGIAGCDSEGAIQYEAAAFQTVYFPPDNYVLEGSTGPGYGPETITGNLEDGTDVVVTVQPLGSGWAMNTSGGIHDNSFGYVIGHDGGFTTHSPMDITMTFDRPVNGVLNVTTRDIDNDAQNSSTVENLVASPAWDTLTPDTRGEDPHLIDNIAHWDNFSGTVITYTWTFAFSLLSDRTFMMLGFPEVTEIGIPLIESGTYCCKNGVVTYYDKDGNTIDASLVLEPVTC